MILAAGIGCGKAGNGSRSPEAAAPAPAAPRPGELQPQAVVVIFRRDSLHLPTGAPPDSVTATLQRAITTLQQTHRFEVIAISPSILAVKVSPPAGQDPRTLASALAREPRVAQAEVEGVAGRP
jgi:hypothetical protein